MTRKHFIAIAEILRDNNASDKLIDNLSNYFSEQNGNFNFSKFKDAAKGE